MQIPVLLAVEIARLAAEHYGLRGMFSSPASFGSVVMEHVRYLQERGSVLVDVAGVDSAELVAWAGRYGKSLGEFFINERSL